MLISKAKKLNQVLENPEKHGSDKDELAELGKQLSQTRLVKSDNIQVDAFFAETLKEKLYYDWTTEKQTKSRKKNWPFLRYAGGFAMTVAALALLASGGLNFTNNNSPLPLAPNNGENRENNESIANLVQPLNAFLTCDRGRAEIWDNGAWVTAPEGMVVSADRQIRTLAESRALLSFGDGSSIRLAPESHIIIEESNTENIIIQQITGKSYSRVNKSGNIEYIVRSLNAETRALGTAFSVGIGTDNTIDIKAVESKISVFIITENETLEAELTEGEETVIDSFSNIAPKIGPIDQSDLQNDFFSWNKELDYRENQPLGKLYDIEAPELRITNPANGTATDRESVTLAGVTENGAKIEVNGQPTENFGGKFNSQISLNRGKNIIEIKAVDKNNNVSYAAILVEKIEKSLSTAPTTQPEETAEPIEPEQAKTNPPKEQTIKDDFQLVAVPKEKGTYLTWLTGGMETTWGFAILLNEVGNPTYPKDFHYHFPYAYGRHYFQALPEKGTYYLRVCQFLPNGKCGAYSNTVKVER